MSEWGYEVDVHDEVETEIGRLRDPWEESEQLGELARLDPPRTDFSFPVNTRIDDHGRTRRIIAPRSTDQLKKVIDEARQAGVTLKPVSHTNRDQGHSFSKIVRPRDYQLSLKYLAGASYDDQTERVAVNAGTRIREAVAELLPHDRAFTNMGAYDGQTLVGAICTDTHGSGVWDGPNKLMGPFSTLVDSFQVMTQDGELIEVDRGDHDLFNAAIVGLGCFGVVTSVTVRTEPAYRLKEKREYTTWQTIRDDLPDLLRDTRHVNVAISPYTEDSANPCLLTTRERTDEPANGFGQKHRSFSFELTKVAPGAPRLLLQRLMNQPVSRGKLVRQAMQSAADDSYVGPWNEVLLLGLNVLRYESTEIGIELDDEGDWRDVVDAVLMKLHPWRRPFFFPTAPISLRFCGPSTAFLSPQYARPTVMIELPFLQQQWSDEARARDGVREIHDFLVRGHGGRPHWGKRNFMTWSDVQRNYDDDAVGDWLDHYAEMNSSGIWNNDFTRQLGISR